MAKGLMHAAVPWIIRRCGMKEDVKRSFIVECLQDVMETLLIEDTTSDPQLQTEIKCYLDVLNSNLITIMEEDGDDDALLEEGDGDDSEADDDSADSPTGLWCKDEVVFVNYSRFCCYI
jgi:hypothetical protein